MTQLRSTRSEAGSPPLPLETASSSCGLLQAVRLLFEAGATHRTGVDLPEPSGRPDRLGGMGRKAALDLPGLSEPEAVRHYVRLSQRNYAIDLGLFPLGSCTMKHNPRLNEKMARLPGFADLHPLQPQETVQGAFALMELLSHWLVELTGMHSVSLTPKAGAQGELCGMLAIRAALEARGELGTRRRVLVPASAHGTNPATAAACGFVVDEIPAGENGRVDLAAFEAKLGPDVAGIMLTNPNTCGLFEPDIKKIADDVHAAGGYFYCDGANYNAIVGKVRPGDLGIDAMHINLHKTFSTPHGGGGPGSGPTVFSAALTPFAPTPRLVRRGDGLHAVEHAGEEGAEHAFGRLCAFHGQMGMFVRAMSYMLSHGANGLKQVAEDSVLNANYLLARLSGAYNAPFGGPCMHEALFDDSALRAHGLETIDLAKALCDEGYHPMTTYFPLVVHGALLVEPTETESLAELDRFADVMLALAERAQADPQSFKAAPRLAPVRRLDETQAARKPRLRWTPNSPERVAAE